MNQNQPVYNHFHHKCQIKSNSSWRTSHQVEPHWG